MADEIEVTPEMEDEIGAMGPGEAPEGESE